MKSLLKCWKQLFCNEKGFTLLEAIISIATLSLLSAFILQMFVVSATANQKAKRMDVASAEAMTAIELFKGSKSPSAFTQDPFIKDAVVRETNKGYLIEKKYEDFVLSVNIEVVTPKVLNTLEENAVTGFTGLTSASEPSLYQISVTMFDESPNINMFSKPKEQTDRILVSYETKKYFSN